LLFCNKDRTPARENIRGTVLAWLEALSSRRYDRERDTPRIRAAFTKLLEARAWPQPADFLDAMPRVIQEHRTPPAKRLGNDAMCTRGLMHTRAIFGEMRLNYDGKKGSE
jgi:hypothetical protein